MTFQRVIQIAAGEHKFPIPGHHTEGGEPRRRKRTADHTVEASRFLLQRLRVVDGRSGSVPEQRRRERGLSTVTNEQTNTQRKPEIRGNRLATRQRERERERERERGGECKTGDREASAYDLSQCPHAMVSCGFCLTRRATPRSPRRHRQGGGGAGSSTRPGRSDDLAPATRIARDSSAAESPVEASGLPAVAGSVDDVGASSRSSGMTDADDESTATAGALVLPLEALGGEGDGDEPTTDLWISLNLFSAASNCTKSGATATAAG
jgi:hypothetical protein